MQLRAAGQALGRSRRVLADGVSLEMNFPQTGGLA
jgi:hypothetical protein